jgi:hypothetical protein
MNEAATLIHFAMGGEGVLHGEVSQRRPCSAGRRRVRSRWKKTTQALD